MTEKLDQVTLLAPVTGRLIPLTEIKDRVVSSGKMGPGFGIEPTTGNVCAPVTGVITLVAATKHAVGLRTPSGLEVLIHLGIDTVTLAGRPFDVHVQVGTPVTAGQRLVTMDRGQLQRAHCDATVMTIVTNQVTTPDQLFLTTTRQVIAKTAVALLNTVPSQTLRKPQSVTESNGELATTILANIGGETNVATVTHCMTRLRFQVKDGHRVRLPALKKLARVLDVVVANGQYQVVIGPTVGEVYAAVTAQLKASKGDQATAGLVTQPWQQLKMVLKAIVEVMTAAMLPVIGVLAGAGLLKGVLAGLVGFQVLKTTSATYLILNAISDAAFYFLPIILGIAAAKKLGSDPIVMAIVGAVLVYPTIIKAAGKAVTAQVTFMGIPTHLVTYSATVFPIIVAAWLGKYVEWGLAKGLPVYLRRVFGPILEVLVLSLVVILGLGPLITVMSQTIANGILAVYNLSPTLSGVVLGGLYQTMVIFGLHWGLLPLVLNDLTTNGHSYLNAMISVTMVAQGGAVLAVGLKAKDKSLRDFSIAAAVAAFCGITEPALYGVNLKSKRIFILASIGSAIGGGLTGILRVNNYALSGSLIGFSAFITPGVGIGTNFYGYLISHYATLLITLGLVVLVGFGKDWQQQFKSRLAV